jgi:membrane protein implicated in regulation of membrane protease activity
MEIQVWHIWIIVAVLLFIIENFAPTFIASCIAIGCISSGIFAYFNFGIKIQLIAFSIGALTSFFGVRPFMLKYVHKKSEHIKTNVDALVGKVGTVIVTIDGSQNQGRVIVEGDDWRADTENNEIIKVGEKVEVLKIHSTILIVKQITNN